MGKRLTMTEDTAIRNYVKGIKEALEKTKDTNQIIILETGAGVGTEVCTKIDKLNDLYNKFTDAEKERLMFCIDTCHVFAAGYDLGDPKYIKTFDKLIKDTITWKKVSCVHLNDSKCPLSSCKDRHADLEHGLIDSKGLKKFVKLCYGYNIPIVLETPCDTIDDNCKDVTAVRKREIKLVKEWTK
jgi:deoxyribonuclease-4